MSTKNKLYIPPRIWNRPMRFEVSFCTSGQINWIQDTGEDTSEWEELL